MTTDPASGHGARQSIWNATVTAPKRPILQGSVACDVAIVGAGIVGITAAVLLQRAGKHVAVVEAGAIGAGVTGQTTGKVTSQHGISHRKLLDRFGVEAMRLHAKANQDAVGLVRAWSGPKAQWVDAPNYVYTSDPARVAEFEAEADAACELGLPARMSSETELPFAVAAAVRFDAQGHFHPRSYVLKLAAELESGGASLFEGSRVVDMQDGTPCRARTAEGELVAQHLLVTTHVPILDDWAYVTRMNPKREYGLAAHAGASRIRGMYVSGDEPRRSVRPFDGPEGPMLVFVGETHAAGEREPKDHIGPLAGYAREFGAGAPTHHWSSQDYYPLDDMPLVGRYGPTSKATFAASGFRAWGLTQGTVAGHLLADLVLDRDHPLRELYDPFSPKRLAKTILTPRMLHSSAIITEGLVGARLPGNLGTAEKAGEKGKPLAPGQGRIESRGIHKVAVCQTRAGDRHELLAACTHKGCIVAWNPLEESWDCPCHASRFAADGKVLRGPTVKPLKPYFPG